MTSNEIKYTVMKTRKTLGEREMWTFTPATGALRTTRKDSFVSRRRLPIYT